jgi:hypothetical protein
MSEIKNVKLGNTQVDKIYVGENLNFIYEAPDLTAPITTPYPDPTVTYNAGREIYFEVNETCYTYYTLDGTPVTENSTLYTAPIVLNADTTINYFSVDLAGNAEIPKTVDYTIISAGEIPITYISPSTAIQNTIPITVDLTRSILDATTYYKIGAGTQQTFAAPFSVNQTNVNSTQIPITYWSVSTAGAVEAQRTLTYDTSGAIAGKAVVTATPYSWYVSVDWTATANATSYNVYRSTISGTLGDLVSEFNTGLHYDDNTAINNTTYYYTVRAANYGGVGAVSDQVAATPTAAPTGWRYLKIEGYGAAETGQEVTTRMIEFEAWEGATNHMTAATILSGEAPSNAGTGGTLAQIKNGVKTTTSNSYPYWWTATPNANIVIDLLAARALTKLNYYGYSISGTQRTNRFRVLASNTNNGVDWVSIWDNSAGQAGLQPILPSGYEKTL